MNKIDLSIFKNIIAYGIGQSYYHLLPRLSHVKFNYVMDKRWEENLEEYQCDGIEIIRKKDICHLVNVLIVVIPESESIFNQVSEAFADYDNVEICRVFELVKSVQSVSGSNLQKLLPITEYKDEYGNTIRFDESVSDNINITFYGNNNKVVIGNNVAVQKMYIACGNNAYVSVGDNTSVVGAVLHASEADILIGRECMLSFDIIVRNHDDHHIFDLVSHERVNKNSSVIIGNHVWISRKATILKGCKIGDGTVVGDSAVVTSSSPRNVVLAGVPARVVREKICWSRDNTFYFDRSCFDECIDKSAEKYV